MNCEINIKNFNTKIISTETDVKLFLLLILSVIFIPAAYIFVATVFVLQAVKKCISMERINSAYLLTLIYILIGVVFSQYKLISSAYGILMLLCLYSYSLFGSKLNSLDYNKVKKIFLILSIITFVIGIFQYISPEFTMPAKWVDSEEYQLKTRIYSTFFNPNIFGFYINFIILIVCENLNLKRINLEWIVFFTGIICLFLTFSRTAWVSIIVALIITSMFNKKYLKFAVIISIFVFGIDAILGLGRMDPIKATSDSSLYYRLEIWKACIKIIKNNFITGIGFGTLFKHISQYSHVVKTNIEHCHNLYLQIFTETGILGFIISSVSVSKLVKFLWVKIHKSKNNQPWITAWAILSMTMIHGMVDSVFFTPQILMILSIYSGTLSAIEQ